MRKLYISTALWLAAAGIAGAQNLNPQVQVTNDYKTNMGEARKQAVELEIPDSLTSFKTLFTPDAFVKTTVVPFILMLFINFIMLYNVICN